MSKTNDKTWKDVENILIGVIQDSSDLGRCVWRIDHSDRIPDVLFPRLRRLQKALKRVGDVIFKRYCYEIDRTAGTTTITEAIAKIDEIARCVRTVKERCSDALKETGVVVKVNPSLVYQIDDVLGTMRVACCFTERKEIIAADASNAGGETR